MAKRENIVIKRTRTLSILLPILLLLGIGLVMVYDASVAEAERLFHNKYYFVQRHAVWIALGLFAMALASRISTSLIRKIGPLLFGLTTVMLVVVLIPGVGSTIQGARRWISIGNFVTFQPSELVKLTTVLYLSSWFRHKPKPLHFFAFCGFLVGLLMLQPDFGTAMILVGTSFLMLFLSGASLGTIVAGIGIGAAAMFGLIVIAPYRLERLATYLNPSLADRLGSGYHVNQALLALGSGGVFGLGLGRSRQKFQYLPEASTDSIFAVIGEEMGFIGALIILLIFVYLFYQLFRVISREPQEFRKLLAAGLTGWLAIQTVINVGSMIALFPLTGIPLPFISYGGSSLITQLLSIGIIVRITLTQP